jgi:hypothetical protein
MVKWGCNIREETIYGDTWKVTSDELLTKQAMRILLYTKNMYILKQLHNVLLAGFKALVSE